MTSEATVTADELNSLINEVRQGNVRATGRIISLLENDSNFARAFIKGISPFYAKKPRIGITGSPGVGKSTLINQLIKILHGEGKKVSVVAVDPTSPFSGGAILGDRIRMDSAQMADGVFIRSMGSRGSLGGLSSATANVVRILEVFTSDIVIVETVGMGQTGFDIVDIADSVVLLLSPESGDGIQTMKAGVMEIADIYVINKADRPGADGLFSEVSLLLSSIEDKLNWIPPVIKTCSISGEGVSEILNAFYEHQKFLKDRGLQKERRRRQIMNELRFIVESKVRMSLNENKALHELHEKYSELVESGEIDTYSAAEAIISELVKILATS